MVPQKPATVDWARVKLQAVLERALTSERQGILTSKRPLICQTTREKMQTARRNTKVQKPTTRPITTSITVAVWLFEVTKVPHLAARGRPGRPAVGLRAQTARHAPRARTHAPAVWGAHSQPQRSKKSAWAGVGNITTKKLLCQESQRSRR